MEVDTRLTAYWAIGDLVRAYKHLNDSVVSFRKVGDDLFALSSIYVIAKIQLVQGNLHDAK